MTKEREPVICLRPQYGHRTRRENLSIQSVGGQIWHQRDAPPLRIPLRFLMTRERIQPNVSYGCFWTNLSNRQLNYAESAVVFPNRNVDDSFDSEKAQMMPSDKVTNVSRQLQVAFRVQMMQRDKRQQLFRSRAFVLLAFVVHPLDS